MKLFNEGKDYRWTINDEGDNKFSISKKVFYLNNVGTVPGEPNNTIQIIKDYVIEKIGIDNLVDEINFHWEQIDPTYRLVKLTFEIK